MKKVVDNLPFHTQAGLSQIGSIVSDRHPLSGKYGLRFGRIKSINRQLGLVSVTNDNDHSYNRRSLSKTIEDVQLPVKDYGVNTSGQWFGSFPNVGIGERVLIGFINGNASAPVVIQAYPDRGMMKHISPTGDNETTNNDANFDDYRSQKEVLPSQHVILHTGTGDYVHTLNGNSFVAALDPGEDNIDQPWQHDMYTGLPSTDNKYGYGLKAFTDKSDGSAYHIQNQQAQDMMLVHQSSIPGDHHMTKIFIGQDGHIHTFVGSKTFQNDSITKDASIDKGYHVKRNFGKSNVKEQQDIAIMLQYAKSQVGKHPYSHIDIDHPPKKTVVSHGRKIKMIKKGGWHFNNEIVYDPDPKVKKGSLRGSGSNGFLFIWSVLSTCNFDVPKSPWDTIYDMVYDLTKVKVTKQVKKNGRRYTKIFPPQAGDIAVETYIRERKRGKHGEFAGEGVFYRKPSMLLENYHGAGTKVIADYPAAKNVKITKLGNIYDLHSHPTDEKKVVGFYRPSKTLNTATGVGIGSDNSVQMAVDDPNTIGRGHRNNFYMDKGGSKIRTMGHSVSTDGRGMALDGELFSHIVQDYTRPLQRSMRKIVGHTKQEKHDEKIVDQNYNSVVNWGRSHGYTSDQIAGMLANAFVESYLGLASTDLFGMSDLHRKSSSRKMVDASFGAMSQPRLALYKKYHKSAQQDAIWFRKHVEMAVTLDKNPLLRSANEFRRRVEGFAPRRMKIPSSNRIMVKVAEHYLNASLQTTSARFVYMCAQQANFRVPPTPWDTKTMQHTPYLRHIGTTIATTGDVFVIDSNGFSAAGILMEPYGGQNTKIIMYGDITQGVSVSSLGRALDTSDMSDISFYALIPPYQPGKDLNLVDLHKVYLKQKKIAKKFRQKQRERNLEMKRTTDNLQYQINQLEAYIASKK